MNSRPYPDAYETLLAAMTVYADEKPIPWKHGAVGIVAPLRGQVQIVMHPEEDTIAVQIFRDSIPISPIKNFGEKQINGLQDFLNAYKV